MENNQKKLLLLKDLGLKPINGKKIRNKRFGLYKCYCGKEFEARTENVNYGNTTSCGCFNNLKRRQRCQDRATHNMTNHILFNCWNRIIQRCTNPKNKSYKDYGERGISICSEWLDVKKFIEDMHPTYIEGLTIDRIDVNKGYSKDNCRWETKKVQARNKRIIQVNNKSGYKGVSICKDKFRALIRVDRKSIHLGYFHEAIDGAKAYDQYIINNNLEHTLNGVLNSI